MQTISALILAGGESRRMGRDKALLSLDGDSLLERQVKLAKFLGADELFVSGRPGVDYSPLSYPILLDKFPGAGPLAGIERGLAMATTALVLVLAVDLPFVQACLLQDLLKGCSANVGAVPKHERGIEPLVGFYPRACHELARELLQKRQWAAQGFALECARRNLIKLIPFDSNRRDFTNWNRPEDVRFSTEPRLP